jgi:Nickel responsive protein SCO4226-like
MEEVMTLFMDSHSIDGGVKVGDVAEAHLADLKTQERYGVHYLRYWVDERAGRIFCLVDAPDAEAARRVHREAHGLVADSIHPVVEGS